MEKADNGIKFANTGLPDIVELRNVTQVFDGVIVLENFNLLIEDHPNKGQFVVILGKSGCGKSTVLKYLAGLQKPTSGEILINGEPLKKPIPMVFQTYSNFPWRTVLENVMLPLELRGEKGKEVREKAMAMLEKVDLQDHAHKYAQDTVLSGGQMQRVAIARSLMADARIILMDEPFGKLDIFTKLKLRILLARIWEELQSTVVFVTHDIQEAVFLADDVYIMSAKPGRIVRSFHIDLPVHKTREIQKDKRFIDQVNEIDDTLYELASK